MKRPARTGTCRAGLPDRREDGRSGADPSGSVVVADLDHARISEAVVTRDQTARRARHINWGRVGVGNSRGSEQRAGGNTDTDAGAPVRVSLGAAAGGDEAACECQCGQSDCGDLGLRHDGLHPVELGRRQSRDTHWSRTPEKGSKDGERIVAWPLKTVTNLENAKNFNGFSAYRDGLDGTGAAARAGRFWDQLGGRG